MKGTTGWGTVSGMAKWFVKRYFIQSDEIEAESRKEVAEFVDKHGLPNGEYDLLKTVIKKVKKED